MLINDNEIIISGYFLRIIIMKINNFAILASINFLKNIILKSRMYMIGKNYIKL